MKKEKRIKKENKKSLDEESLPEKLGIISLSIILGIGHGLLEVFEAALEGPKAFTMPAVYKRITNRNDLWYYYDKIKQLSKNNFRVTLYRLQKKGLVAKKKDKFHLTALGQKLFKKLKNENKNWDNKWRMIIFDIPEDLKYGRDWLRSKLYNLGYKLLQKSVFIGKYPLEEDFYKEIKEKKLDKYINLLTIGEIDNEEILERFDQ